MNLIGNEFDKLNHMYYLIWSSGNIVIGNSSDNTYDLI